MNKFIEWLTDEARGWAVVGYAMLAALVVISLDYTVHNALLNWEVIPRPEYTGPLKDTPHPFKGYNVLMFLAMFVWGPIKEEVFHRVVPLTLLTAFVSRSPLAVLGLNALFAAIFGAIHPYGLEGKILVAIGGFFFGLVFLKCGGLSKSYIKASVAAVLAHGFTNVLLVLDELWQYYELIS